MKYGDLGKRIAASLIDGFILAAIIFVVGFAFTLVGLAIALPVVAPLILLLYYILLEGGSSHATVGKKMMGLYVAYSDGNGITYSTSVMRLIGKALSSLTLGIGYLMGFFNDEKQCLHDMIAKTYVLSGNAEFDGLQLVAVNGPLAGAAYPITEKGLLIGRDSVGCDIVLPASQSNVSRNHCFVTYNPASDMVIVNDRNSTHGTFFANGEKIMYNQPAALKVGDRFYLATPETMFEVK